MIGIPKSQTTRASCQIKYSQITTDGHDLLTTHTHIRKYGHDLMAHARMHGQVCARMHSQTHNHEQQCVQVACEIAN